MGCVFLQFIKFKLHVLKYDDDDDDDGFICGPESLLSSQQIYLPLPSITCELT